MNKSVQASRNHGLDAVIAKAGFLILLDKVFKKLGRVRIVILVEVEQLMVGSMLNFAYILKSDERKAAVVDASFGARILFERLKKEGLELKYILSTHHHFDHVNQNEELASLTGAEIVAHANSPIKRDISVADGQTIRVGEIVINVVHTPGHTTDSVCYYADNSIFTGDTLFVGECGRVDLPGGSAQDMYFSLFQKLCKLPEETVVYPGHDYGAKPTSTIGYEKRHNYVLKRRTLEEFLEFMATP
jgi:hydroxyacylglutathione hydrolase